MMMKIIEKSICKEFDLMKNQFHHENLSRQIQMEGQMKGERVQNILVSDADASRLHKGPSLPSRRLVPRILAALAAGAVTFGALPCAYADIIVRPSVTTDLDAQDGVAGSIDGSAGTITVGTEGGGAAPVISGPHGVAPVYGSWYKSTAPSFTLTLTGGRALIRSGTMGYVSSAQGTLTSGGALRVLNGEALITGGKMSDVYGSSADVVALGSADGAAEAAQGRVTVTGGEVQGNLYGGRAVVTTNSGEAHAAARGNRVYLRGGSYQNDISGGYAMASSTSGTETAIAEDNTVYISGGTYLAGAIYAGMTNAVGTTIARRNTIEITGAPGLSLPELKGGWATTSEDNALIVRNTKNISAVSVEKFQRYTFYAPPDLAESDAMLSLRRG